MHSQKELVAIWVVLFTLHMFFPSFDLNWAVFAVFAGLRFVVYIPGGKNLPANLFSILIGMLTIITLIQVVVRNI